MGKPKYIETPEILWQHFEEYKKETKSKPFLVKDWVGKDALDVYREKERPLTMEGFECWLSNQNIIADLSHYFSNYEQRYTDYLAICSRVKKSIRQDQIEGGMAGMYNPSITQRLNNLVEKTQTEVSVTKFDFDE
jgi:hypothetical protein